MTQSSGVELIEDIEDAYTNGDTIRLVQIAKQINEFQGAIHIDPSILFNLIMVAAMHCQNHNNELIDREDWHSA